MKNFLIDFENKYIFSILLAYTFALPFNNLTSVNSILMGLLFFFWALRFFTSKQQVLFRTPIDIPLMAYFTWVGLTLIWTVDFYESFNSFIALGKQIFLFYLIITTVKSKDHFFKILVAFLLSILIICFIAIFNFFDSGGTLLFKRYILAGTMGSADPMLLNAFMIMFLPLSIIFGLFSSSKFIKIPLYFVSAIFIFTLYITYERAGWLAFFFQTLILIGFISKKLLFKVLASIFCLGFVIYLLLPIFKNNYLQNRYITGKIDVSDFDLRKHYIITDLKSLDLRIKVWKFGWDKLSIHPFLGNGYGREIFSKVFKDNEITTKVPHLHNMFLEIIFEIGIPGLVLLVLCFLKIFSQGYKIFVSSRNNYMQIYALFIIIMTAGILIKNLFDHGFIGSMAEIFWALTALLFVPSLIIKESNILTG